MDELEVGATGAAAPFQMSLWVRREGENLDTSYQSPDPSFAERNQRKMEMKSV